MKRSISKWGVVAIITAAMLLLMAISCALIITTESGTQFVWRRLQPFLPETVTVATLQGPLIGPLAATGVEVRGDGFSLRITRIELDWSLLALLRRELDIQRLMVTEARFIQLAKKTSQPEEEPKPFQLPEEIALPLNVNVEDLQIQKMEYRSAPGADPVEFDATGLKLTINKKEASITEFYTRSPRYFVQGYANLSMKNSFPIEGKLEWRFLPMNYPEVVGLTTIDGNLEEVQLQQKIDTPYGIDATVTIHNLMAKPRFKAQVKAHPKRLHTISDTLPEMAVRMEADGQGNLDAMDLMLTATIEEAVFGEAHIQLKAGFRSDTLFIDDLSVTSPEQPARLTATGHLSLVDERQFQFKTNWSHLQWPLQQARISSPKGELSINGRIDDYDLGVTADLQGPDQTEAWFKVHGRGTLEELRLTQIDMKSLDGRLSGSATLEWDPELAGKVDLNGKGLNPGVIFASWPGDLQLRLRASGRLGNQGPDVNLQALKARGRLRGHAFSLDTQGSYAADKAVLNRFELTSDATHLQAKGTVGETADISWELNSNDIGSLLPDAAGHIRGEGHVTGPIRRPRCDLTLEAINLAYADYRLETLLLKADTDLNGKELSTVSLDLQAATLPTLNVHKLNLRAQGNADHHTLKLVADTSRGTADLSLEGQLRHPWQPDLAWLFHLNQATLTYPKLDAWTLAEPFSGEISTTRIHLSRNCWQSGKAQLCLEGERSEETVQAAYEISTLPFSYFKSYMPEGFELRGGISGKGTYRHIAPLMPNARAHLNTTNVALWSHKGQNSRSEEAKQVIEFLPGHLRMHLQQGELKAGMTLPVSKQEGIELDAIITDERQPLMDRPLRARLRAAFQDLEFIQSWLPGVDALTGRLTGDLSLSGNLRRPAITGRMELSDGAAKLAKPELELKSIHLTLKGEENGSMRLTGRSVSGRGEIKIDGTADFREETARADLRLKGQNFTVVDASHAEVEASPDLKIGLRDNVIHVTGEVVIPRAKIQFKKLPDSAVRVSEDQTIAQPEGEEEKRDLNIDARVRLTMGEAVFFDGFGLTAGIQGGLLAIEKPGKPTTASGELNIVDGKYEAFGQKLYVEKGRVLWAGGPITQPGIDARAVRRPTEDILVGVNVRGDLQQPEVTLFSEPPMTQGNQLSYLVLGRPLSGASTGEGSALSRAALALGLKGGNVVAEKIGGKLGLDQFTVESGTNGAVAGTQKASLVIGKYLTPKLYINYGIGLFDPVSTLRIQYAISSNWKLVTESSGIASGGDLFYTIETGR